MSSYYFSLNEMLDISSKASQRDSLAYHKLKDRFCNKFAFRLCELLTESDMKSFVLKKNNEEELTLLDWFLMSGGSLKK